jgi:hypothetical protein
MTEADAWTRHGDDAVKVDGSLEVRSGPPLCTSDFLWRPVAGAPWPF